MKNLTHKLLILLFFIGFISSAQPSPKKKAQKITNEITKVLDLNKKESKAVYQVQLTRFTEGKAIRAEFSDQPELRKEKLKLLGNRVYNDLKAVVGIERLKQWKKYKQNK